MGKTHIKMLHPLLAHELKRWATKIMKIQNQFSVMQIPLLRFISLCLLFFFLQSCTSLQIIKRVNSGKITANNTKSIIPFELKGHPIIIKCQLNNSEKEYKFMFDTGALTLITQQVANELDLQNAIEVELHGTGGKSEKVDLIQLRKVIVGNTEVQDIAAVVVDLEKKHGVKIDGILGSNFLKFFQVTIDYQKHNITLLHSTQPISAQKDTDIQIPFKTDMKNGFAPRIECIINGNIKCTGILDTGYPAVASIPLSLMKKLDSYQNGSVLSARGSMVGGIVGMAEESYMLRLNTLKISSLQIDNIPSVSHPSKDEHILLGNKFLSKFLITIDYPSGIIVLRPYKTFFETNIFTYGVHFAKKNEKIIVSGVWDNSSASKAGIEPGAEIIKVNSQDVQLLSLFDLMELFLDEKTNSIDIVYILKNQHHTATLKKENILPPLQ